MLSLGINIGHDRGAALVRDGEIVCAISLERLDRNKHSTGVVLPFQAMEYCLVQGRCKYKDLDVIVYNYPHHYNAYPVKDKIRAELFGLCSNVVFVSHHLAHAYGTFYASDFDEASVLVCDGAGNKYTGYAKQFFDNWIWPTKATEEDIEAETCYFFGNDKKELIYKRWQNWSDKRDSLDHKLSLGRMYRETCHHVGMGHLDGGKLMGLAPYGEKLIKPFNIVKRNGDDFDINLRHIKALPSGSFEDNAKAAWIAQYSLEETLVWLANMLYKKKPCRNICIAGGIGLNSVSNERILRESPFENIFIIPACNDSGMALGCAYFGYYHVLGQKQRKPYKAYTGRSYSQQEVIDGAKTTGYEYRQSTDLSGDVAKLIADGKIVGWFQGGSEYGPRALGNRSILCDPRKAVMKDILNHKVKHRENYRPFAPVVLWEEADKFFDIVSECPYMLQIVNVKEDRKNDIAAINHVDGTARVQTVRREQNEKLYDLIEVFGKITNVPVLLNTSFNVAGEPVVETPQDAVKCFLGTQIDVLIVNNFIIEKPVISEKKTDSTVLIEKLKQLCNGKPLKLHLGCGQKYFDDYVNIDYPPENHNVMNVKADLYYDIKKIALPENSVDEIRLHHVFEHFSRVEALALLIKWHKWLKKGGRLHIEVPDLIGSAKTLLSDVSMKVKMGVVRHLSGDQASSWGYHVDQWFGERFEETLYELGFSSIRIQHSQWSREPYLSNVVVTAVKDRNISVSQQLDSADRLLLASTVSPAEEKTYMVWKDQLQKALLNMSIQTETLPSKVKALVFSKDRAMQLMATIESFMSQCKDSVNVDMTVLYKASNSLHYQQYDELKRMFPDVDFVEENNFRNQVLSIINDSTYLLFLVDDSIFVQPFEINKAIAVLKDHEDAIGFSLRLGKNVTYCYPLDRDEIQPQFENISENIFKFNWYNSKCSFGCSLEVSSSVYRTDFILDMFNQFGFSNPNTLESKMSQLKMNYSWLPYLLMFDKSVAFSSPVNKTQKIYNNRSGDNHGYSVEKLAELFDGKKAIDVDRYAGFIPTSVQQETELYLKNRTDVEVDKAKSIVTNNDNDEKYTPESISAVEKPSILKKNKEANGKKRVLLTTSAAPQQSPFSTAEKRMPIGVGYLISVLRDASHEVFFIDNYLEPSNFLETGFLVENQIDFIGIYVNTICFRDTLRMLKKIDAIRKNGCWDGKIIVGGPHTTVAPETIPDFVDFVVQGEGEKAIIDIVEGRVSERVIRYPQIIYLDELPRPAWDVFAKMPYKWDMEWFEESPVFNMNTSRSCPFNCTFCSVRSIWGEKYTYFSAERVVDDVEYVVENFGAKGIYFREDNFTLNKKRLTRFCELMIERKINIPWACESRVSTIDEESIEMMSKAGVRGFYFGVESGSQRILDLLHKGITVEQIRKAFALCHKYNIKAAASMIGGIPGETEEDIRLSKELLEEIKPTTIWNNNFVGMPNSDLYKQVLRENLYEMIDDRGLVYLQGHNGRVKKLYGDSPFYKKAAIPVHCSDLDMADKPKISVLICVYNGQKYIRKTLESIYNQTLQDFEVIIVDDASNDETPAILREMKDSRTFIYRNAKNLGLCKSADIGLGRCRGDHIVQINADDISVPDRFAKQLKVMQDNSAHQEVELYFKNRADVEDNTVVPKFSVVMANYNNEKYVAQAIGSVLGQNFKDWELVVVDDCSTDGSLKVIEPYLKDSRIKLIRHNQNKGYAATLKSGIVNVKSEFFGIFDSDDVLTESAVETMYKSHIDNPGCGLIYSQFAYCDEKLTPEKKGYCAEIPAGKTNLDIDIVSHFKTFKLCDYLKTDGYDERVLCAVDKDIIYKMEEVSKLKFVDEILYLYRVLPVSLSRGENNSLKAEQSMQKIKQTAIARRRSKERNISIGQNQNSNAEAIGCFSAAVEKLQEGDFVQADGLMQQYRSKIDYSKLLTERILPVKSDVDVSVIVVTYNRDHELVECLESLSKQNCNGYEVIVVDNGENFLKDYRQYIDMYVKCPVNLSLSEGRNIGACFAKGRILALLDDDALVGENYISSIKAAFDSYDIYGLRGQAMPKNNPEANKDATNYNRGDRPFATYCDLEGGSAFRKDIFMDMGGMDPLLFGYEGMDLTYRIIQQYNVMNKIIYWPDTVIYHDATTGQGEDIKRKRYELMNGYVKFKHNFDLHQLRGSIESSPLLVKQSAAPFDTDSTPVILIAYNRPKHTLEVLRALKQHNVKNIYVFCDAPKTAADENNVSLVRRLVHSIDWTTPKIIERNENLGLAKSITTAVDHVFEKHDRLILLEDDCVPQQYFFEFMQTCLDKYEQNSKVFGISGYSVPVPENMLNDYPHDLYFSPRIGSWGWATWKQKWQHNNRDLSQLVSLCNQNNIDLTQGGSDIPVSVHNFFTGKLKDVWTLNWVLSVYLNKGCYIYPTHSHIVNIGTDGSGLHCGTTKKFDSCICKIKPTRYPDDVAYDPRMLDNFKSYFQTNPQLLSQAITGLSSISSAPTLKVAQISTTDNRGGAAKVAWMLRQNLATRNINSPMFVKDKFSSEPDVHVITNPTIDPGQFHAQSGLLYYDIRSTSALASNPEFKSADIFHFHNLHGGYFNPFALPELTKLKPSVWTLHDMQAITGHCANAFECDKWQRGCGSCPDLRTYPGIPADQTARMWEDKRKIYEQSQFVVVVPSKWLKSIVDKSILKDKPIHLIYNGIDENIFKPIDNALVRQKLNIPANATVLAFVSDKGLADINKGASFALKAYNYLAAKYPDLYFLSIGGQSPNAPTGRFIQIPHIEDEKVLAHIYSAADLFILPTLADNCPLIVLELMGCGIPIVSFDTGGVPELIDDGQTGLIAPRKDANTLIKLTEKLITDPNTRHRFSLAARQKLLKKFTVTHMTNQYVTLYQNLINNRKSRSKAVPQQKYLVSAIASTYNSESSVLTIPSYPELSDGEVDHSCSALNTFTNFPNLSWDIVRKRKKIRLYLGEIPHMSEYKDLVGLDLRESSPSCIHHDILNPIPLPDNSVYSIQSEDVFEHIPYNKFITVLNELYRVLRPDGLFRLSVPDYRCDVLRDRSVKDAMGNIIFDSFGGRNADGTPGHQWFPIFESIDYAIRNSFFVNSEIEYLHYYKEDGTPVMKYIDYSKGMVTRTPDFDDRVKNPKRPMSLVVDIYKNCFSGQLEYSTEKNKWSLKSDVKIQQTMQSDCLVSAIVSTYNSENFIQGCLEDLVNQSLYQKGKLEIIVVNSGSQQNEEQVVKQFQKNCSNIVYIKTEKREGIYTAWNRAVKIAKGQFITNANTDDRHRQDALEIMSNELLANSDVALVYGDQIVTETANDTFENHHGVDFTPRSDYSHERMLFGCCVGSQPMWRAKLHEELGCFDETLTCAGDWDFWLRISEKYDIKRIPEFLGLYYHNEQGIEHGRKIHSLYERYIVGKRFGNPYISIIPLYQHHENPLVSVIMPAYNAADHIEEAIESVLIQNYQNFELMIINDGSTDNTEQIVKKFDDQRIRYFSQENAGASSARNNGIKRSNGKFIVILDHDDMMTPDFISQHLKAFEENPQADLVYCDDRLIDGKGNPVRVITRPEYTDRKHLIRDLFRCGFPVVPFWTCIKRDVFDKIGFYNEQLIIAEDYDMIKRFVKHGLIARHLKGDYHLRRIVTNSLSRNHTAAKAKSHFDVVKSFTQSFDYEQLFPDVQWDKIAVENRQMHARFLFALTFMAIGQDYVKTNSPVMAKAGFDYAQQQIDMCLEISPDNTKALQLMQKCKQMKSQFAEALI